MKKIILFIFFTVSITACSRIDLAVYIATKYVENRADHFFDLSRDQSKWLKNTINSDMGKVKKTIFPQLAAELFQVASHLEGQRVVDAGMVQLSYSRIKNIFYEGLRLLAPAAVALVDRLYPSQLTVFQKEFDKKMQEIKADDSPKHSYQKMKRNFTLWMGGLNAAQKKELENFVKNNPSNIDEKIKHRKFLVSEFIRVYPNLKERHQFVEGLFTQYESMRQPDFSRMALEHDKKMVILVTSILNEMTDFQRDSLVETLRERANQFLKISKE